MRDNTPIIFRKFQTLVEDTHDDYPTIKVCAEITAATKIGGHIEIVNIDRIRDDIETAIINNCIND